MDDLGFLIPEDDAVLSAAIGNFASLITHMHRGVPAARLIALDDVMIADSSVADDTFNVIALTRFAPDAIDRRVAETIETARATGRPFTWWIDPFAPAGLAQRLEAAGLKETGRMPIMRADLRAEVEFGPVLGELEIRRVTTEEEFAVFARVVAAIWQPPAPTVVEFFGKAAKRILGLGDGTLGDSAEVPSRVFVGYLDGVPICTAQAELVNGVAGLYNIVTAAGHRMRGFGRAMTVAAMRAARDEGYRTVVLEASPMGEPVYRRLGFVTCGQIVEFAV